MIFDHRTYTVKAGTIKKQFELYEEHGWDVQTRHLGQPIVYAGTEVGNVNTYVHIWAYADITDRARKRVSMQADPGWQKYCLLYTSPSPRDLSTSRMPSSG